MRLTICRRGVGRLCSWTDQDGHPVQRPPKPDAAWLSSHEWRWDPTRLDQIIAAAACGDGSPLWLFGQAANAVEFVDRFDLTILLEIDQQTMIARMTNPVRGNDFGRVGDSLAVALDGYRPFVAMWRRRGAVIVDATADVDTVAEELLMVAASAVLRRYPYPD